MRKLMGLTAMALAVATAASATPVVAQPRPVIPILGCTSGYVVQEGDTLWDLAELKLNNPALWSWLVLQNPILQEPGRSFVENGREIVLIRPGEKLYCLNDVGIIRPNNELVEEIRPAQFVEPTPAPLVPEKTFIDYLGDWWWLLALTILGLIAWLVYRESRKDPINSGPPQVNGGVQNLENARTRFESQAQQQHFTVLHVVPGTIHGRMMVRYGDGTERPRVLSGERAFQATIRRADGQVENVYMLQACGNDLRFGGISRYIPGPDFRFVPDVAEEAAPLAAAASTPETSSAVDTSIPADPKKPTLKIELKPAGDDTDDKKASLVRVTGASTEDMTIEVSDNQITLRYYPNTKKG